MGTRVDRYGPSARKELYAFAGHCQPVRSMKNVDNANLVSRFVRHKLFPNRVHEIGCMLSVSGASMENIERVDYSCSLRVK